MTRPGTAAPGVAVIIPNWNGAEHLPECLESLQAQTFTAFETLVVDNGSSDRSLALLAQRYPGVRVLELGHNTGFSGAVNAGIRATSTEYTVLLNNDTRAEPRWLACLVEAMDDEPGASFGACKMLRYDPPHLIDAAGDRYSLWRGSGINIGIGEPRDHYDQPAWVFGACAGAAIYRRSLFDDIGLFDEDFFLTFEDVDFDLRAQVAGHRCLYVPDAIVYHKRGASTDTQSSNVEARAIRNLIWVGGKNLPTILFLCWLFLFPLRMSAKIVRARWRRLMNKPGGEVPNGLPYAVAVGGRLFARSLYEGFSRLFEKRRSIRRLRRLGSLALLSVLKHPFSPKA